VQSNHVRQTAAAACKLGMKCEVLLEHRVADPTELYRNSGNVLLDRIFGANLREYAKGTDFDAAMDEIADQVRAEGGTPYIVPGGASNSVGALGYVGCGEELLQQCREHEIEFDHLVTATGSAGTHAGLAVGLRASGSDLPMLGIGVNAPQDVQEERVFNVGKPGCVSREDIVADCNYIGPGYGEPTDAMNEAVLMLARLEGLLFDPVYSRKGRFAKDSDIVFLHTGGAAGLFAYADNLTLT
jgi:L-cysteate sulfo-lyase